MRSRTPEYLLLSDIIGRCNNKNHKAYKSYGAKNIKVCERWNNLQEGLDNLLKDMGPKPEKGCILKRIDIEKDYSPENCYWDEKQRGNTQAAKLSPEKVKIINKMLDSGKYSQKEIAKIFGVNQQKISKIKNKKNWL